MSEKSATSSGRPRDTMSLHHLLTLISLTRPHPLISIVDDDIDVAKCVFQSVLGR